MGVQGLRILATFLFISQVYQANSQYANSQTTSTTTACNAGSQSAPGQFVLPAVIEPVVRPYPVPCPCPYPQPSPFQPNFNDLSNYQQPPPIIILDNAKDDNSMDLIYLLLLANKNKRGGGLFGSGGCGCGGGCSGSCGCGGYSGCCGSYDNGFAIPPITLTITSDSGSDA